MKATTKTSARQSLQTINEPTHTTPVIPVYERLSKTPIGHKRNKAITRQRSKSFDELPEIDPAVSSHISKQFKYLQDEYSSGTNYNRRKSLLKKRSNDDIVINSTTKPLNENEPTIRARSTIRQSIQELHPASPTRPHTQPAPRRTIHRQYSKDDSDLPSPSKPAIEITASQISPHPPSPQRPVPPPPRRVGAEGSSRILKRGMSKDDSDIPTTTTSTTASSTTTTFKSPRKQWISSSSSSKNQQHSKSSSTSSVSPSSSNSPPPNPTEPEPPSLILERPKLYWRQRISALFYVFLHVNPNIQSGSLSFDLYSSYYFEIIPMDVDKKFEFERVYVSLATLLQMKSKEFNAIIEARPRSITSAPYATREEIERVGKIKQEIKQKMLIETAAEYCADNLDIIAEEFSDEKIHLILKRYHEESQGLVLMNIPKPANLQPIDISTLSMYRKSTSSASQSATTTSETPSTSSDPISSS